MNADDFHEKGSIRQNEAGLRADFELADETQILTSKERRKLALKIDIRLFPVILALYFINILDRTSLGGATAYGFRRDVGLQGTDYNLGITLFYLFYVICELPSNLILKQIGAKVWLPAIGIAYGACSLGTAFIHNRGQFFAVRVLLGITEAGTLPGASYLMALYYDNDQLSLRIQIFMASAILANAVNFLLVNAYVSVGRISSLIYGWRNIFFINAMLTFAISIVAFVLLPHSVQSAKWLTDKEKEFIMTRSKRLTAGLAREEKTKGPLIWRAFVEPMVYFGLSVWWIGQILSASLLYFLTPILQQEFGLTGNQANIRVSAIFFVNIVLAVGFGVIADKTRMRSPCILTVLVLVTIGTCMFLFATNPNVRYGGAFLSAMAISASPGLSTAWVSANVSPYTTKSSAIALTISVGSLGGMVGSWVFLPQEASRGYPTGKVIMMTFLISCTLTVALGMVYVWWENRQRRSGNRDHRLNLSPEQVELLGSRHPHFRLTY